MLIFVIYIIYYQKNQELFCKTGKLEMQKSLNPGNSRSRDTCFQTLQPASKKYKMHFGFVIKFHTF